MYDVITVGSATIDVFAHTDKSDLITLRDGSGKEDFIAYPSGSKLIINELLFTIGGGGTNTATSFRRLGLRTGFVGEVGKDENGKMILNFLKKEKITFLGTIGKEMTGYSVVLDSIAHDRTILTYKGCNDACLYKDLDLKKLQTRWFYFSSMMGSSLDMLGMLAAYATKTHAKLAFNPSSYLVCLGPKKIKPILDHCNLLILNREEAQTLVDGEGFGNKRPIEDLLQKVRLTDIVVVTDGSNGAYAFDGLHIYHAKARKQKVVESTGAGDAFASTFLAAVMKNKSIEESLQLAVTNAESVLQHHGAKNNLLSWPMLLRASKAPPVKVTKKKI